LSLYTWGIRMQASDLLQMLESNEIDVLDNQAVIDEMAGGVDSTALLGDMNADMINTSFMDDMPDPNEALLENSNQEPLLSFDTQNDTPGLG